MKLKRLIAFLLLLTTMLIQHHLDAQTLSITYSDEMPFTQGNVNDTLMVEKFNRNIGQLSSILISIEINGRIDEYIESFECYEVGNISCNHFIDIYTVIPTDETLEFNITKQNTYYLGPFDGIVDFDGISGETRKEISLKEMKTWNYEYNSLYVTNNKLEYLKFPFSASSIHKLLFDIDCRARFLTYSYIKLSITYTYSPPTGSIGDYVWLDQNEDGVQDDSEIPLSGIILNLIDNSTGQVSAVDTTGAGGMYLFDDVPEGNYRVTVVASSLPQYYVLTTNNLPYDLVLSPAQNYLKADFGYTYSPPTGSIGDYVWLDQNEDGVQDASETSLSGIILNLIDNSTGQVIAVDTTGVDGMYLFDNVPEGNYRVTVVTSSLPQYYVLTTNNLPYDLALSPAQNQLKADFGYTCSPPTGSIGDYVWLDQNEDGVQDASEIPLSGIILNLIDNSTGQVIAVDTTGAGGMYLFDNVPEGNYRVTVLTSSLPQYYVLTTNNLPYDLALSPAQNHLQADFGYTYSPPTGSIGDYVWLDQNEDGVQDASEPPLVGIILHLFDDATGAEIAADTTDASGIYGFEGVQPGNYHVTSDKSLHCENLHLTTNNCPCCLNLQPAQQFLSADFGYMEQRSQESGPVVANFTANPTTGISPVDVIFNNESENATHAHWYFGDGSESEEWSPHHIYTNPPLKYYDVTLIVWNDEGECDTLKRCNYIQIFRKSFSNFHALTIAGRPGIDIQFMNCCGGLANFFTWNYGDGEHEIFRSEVRNAFDPVHTYQETGSFNVTLTASGQGGSDTLILNNYIFIDEDYCELTLIDSSYTEPGYGWSKVIDHDVLTERSSMIAPNSKDVLGTFMFSDSSTRLLHTVRFKCNDNNKHQQHNHLARRFEVWVSEDGDRYYRCSKGYLDENERWETYTFEPVIARYIKLNFRSARKRKSPYITLCEFQVCADSFPSGQAFGEPSASSASNAKNEIISNEFRLFQNFPNPFNPETTIAFNLPNEGIIDFKIFDVCGRYIYSKTMAINSAGFHTLKWCGQNSMGNQVQSGVYFYRLIYNSREENRMCKTGKMIMLK